VFEEGKGREESIKNGLGTISVDTIEQNVLGTISVDTIEHHVLDTNAEKQLL
jgi:hypothetical protein